MTPRLGYPVFDGDNHMYETRDALTKFLPPEYHGAVRYVEVDGRTKIATLGQISDYIPNPTFDKVAAPGAQEDYFHNGNPEGKPHREILGKAIEATPRWRTGTPAGAARRAGHRQVHDVPHAGKPGGRAFPRAP